MRFLLSVVSAITISSAVAFVPSSPSSSSSSSIPHRSPSALRSGSSSGSATATDITGTVKWYNEERGFGFIARDDGGPDMYVHATGLAINGPLAENDRVSFAEQKTYRVTNT